MAVGGAFGAFFSILVALNTCIRHSSAVTQSSNVLALLAFKGAQYGQALDSWIGDPCSAAWLGVKCGNSKNSGNGSVQVVTGIQLRTKGLGGTLPKELGLLRNLTDLVLVDCGLRGSIPPEIGNMTSLQYIFLDKNNLEGQLPSSLGVLTDVLALSVTDNQLNGTIPDTIGRFATNMVQLLLSNNSFTGPLPSTLNKPSLLLRTDNTMLCVPWRDPTCLSATPRTANGSNAAGTVSDKPGGVSTILVVVILAVVSLIALGAVLLALLYFMGVRRKDSTGFSGFPTPRARFGSILRPRKRKQSDGDAWVPPTAEYSIHRIAHKPGMGQVFTYKELQSATNNFSAINIIGEGGFGSVYRGVLGDGRIAAIKRLDRNGRQGDKEFRVEVDMLTRLGSPWLVDLMGYCADNDQRLLVYEYMRNGSVQDHLYTDGMDGSPPLLDWGTRMRIALDAARGLEYLHEYASPPVIHRDFKSSNVLLDENFCAKVSDFGLAKLGADNGGHVSTRVLGTQGYVAPEYALTGHLTTKSDVYSYGIVLLELLTGRLPLDSKRAQGETVLVTWALPMLTDKARLLQIVDPVIAGQFTIKDLSQVAAIAAMCVQPEAEYRPLMTDIVQSLLPLVKQQTQTVVTEDPKLGALIVTTRPVIQPDSLDTLQHANLRSAVTGMTSPTIVRQSSSRSLRA